MLITVRYVRLQKLAIDTMMHSGGNNWPAGLLASRLNKKIKTNTKTKEGVGTRELKCSKINPQDLHFLFEIIIR